MYDYFVLFFFKQKTAYEMRISDWSSDVCSSDLLYELRTGAGRCGGADQPPSGRISVHALHRHRAGLLMSEDDISMAPTPFEEGEDGRAPSRWRRLAIWAAAVLGALAVLVAGLSAYLNSDPGQRMLVRQIAIGRAHVCTPVTTAQLVCRLLLE